MPRIIGIDVPGNKRIAISLTYIYGIGKVLSLRILEKLGIDPDMRAHHLGDRDIARLNAILQSDYLVEGELKRKERNDIKRLVEIRAYRGLRHQSGLPVRGQRTRCNARSRKGRKKAIAGKKRAPGPS